MNIRTNEALVDALAQGNKLKYIFFWGHQHKNKAITKSCFSQWYDSPFRENNLHYLTAEHYMMHSKAILFNDNKAAERILNAKTSGEAKAIGREILHFDENKWIEHRFAIVVKANLAKFTSTPELKAFLISTGDRILVEASPVDKIWGIGMATDHPSIEKPAHWQGLNLLGYTLMEVRSQLKG